MKIMVVKDRNVLNTKFLAQFVSSLSSKGHEVLVVCDTYRKQGSGVTLPEGVRFVNLNGKTKNPLVNFWRRAREILGTPVFRFSRFIEKEKPDIIFCYFLVDLYNVAFLQRHNIPIVMLMHCYPPAMLGRLQKKPKWKIYQKCAEQVSVFHVLMKSYEKTIAPYFKNAKVATVPNEVVQLPEAERVNLEQEKKRIIYVARVEKEGKRQHLIVEAFAKVAKDFPDWVVEFWGLQKYQNYNDELMALARKYGIENNIKIMGYSDNIQDVYRTADIHAFASLHEGFSLALADGMAIGLPSIGFKETPSVNELIVDGHNGFLAEDVDDFAEKMRRLMSDKALRIQFGKNAVEDMKAYAPEIVAEQWDELIRKIVKDEKK